MKTAALTVSALLAASVLSGAPARAVSLGQACGGVGGAVCDKGLWCEPPNGLCAATAGVCVAIPRLCFARKRGKSFRPVCGCNSKTYSSDCFRRAYKVGKSHDGKCEAVSATRGSRPFPP
jgi:hypothetical protein